MFLWNILSKHYSSFTAPSLRPQEDVLSDCKFNQICFSVCQKLSAFSKVCRSLGRHGLEGTHYFQNEGIEECGRSDCVPLRLNEMECSTAPLWTNKL
jgi:hypothetical protein